MAYQPLHLFAQSGGSAEYTDCTTAPPPTNVQDMTLNNLMVRLQYARALRDVEYTFITIAPRSTVDRIGNTW